MTASRPCAGAYTPPVLPIPGVSHGHCRSYGALVALLRSGVVAWHAAPATTPSIARLKRRHRAVDRLPVLESWRRIASGEVRR